MIPANLSLVPFSPERRAAMEAIAEVERRRSRGAVSTMYPYASAFFRRLTGSTRITIREIHHFAPVLTARELRGSRDSWLSAIDALIESRGMRCWLPLPVGAGQRLFPEVAFQQTERVRCQDALRDENTPASATRNGASKSGRTRRWRGRRRLSWHSIRRKRSAAGARAGRGLNCASTTWRRCSGAGASVSRHWRQWSAGRWRVSLSGR